MFDNYTKEDDEEWDRDEDEEEQYEDENTKIRLDEVDKD